MNKTLFEKAMMKIDEMEAELSEATSDLAAAECVIDCLTSELRSAKGQLALIKLERDYDFNVPGTRSVFVESE